MAGVTPAIDPEVAAEEVDAVEREPERLALSEPGPSGQQPGNPVALGHGPDQCPHLLDGGGHDFGARPAGQRDVFAWVRCDNPIPHGRPQHRRHRAVDVLDRAGPEDLHPTPDPSLDLAEWKLDWLMEEPHSPEPVARLAALIQQRPEWMARAACRGGASANFFPTRGEGAEPAKAVCAGCPRP